MWNEVRDTILSELSDLEDAAGVTRVAMRLLFAGVLGGLLGYQREHQGKSAGLRTHVLVAMGSATFALVPQLAGASPNDMTRVVQGIVVGIGFLGAGAIVKQSGNGEIIGLTTAAGIWMTAAIGMSAGYGREMTATLSTLFALAALALLPHLAPKRVATTSEAQPPSQERESQVM
jgi:putative Mg2+ transporter-C (MgtC) family protein